MEKSKRSGDLATGLNETDLKDKRLAVELINYKHFFHNSIDLACLLNRDGYLEELNEAFTVVLGYTKKELLGKNVLEFIHPDDVEPTRYVIGKHSLGNKTFNLINRYKTQEGTYRYIEWNTIFNPETQKICSVGRDITEQLIAKNELVFQNAEKEKRAAELNIANKELVFQNAEKEKRAAELIIANKELVFQNTEKEKRAAELIIANKELAFQNAEKEKRAAELIIANKELIFQNEEKEKRAAELIVANKELAFQNEEKEKRAAELIVANKELAFQNEEKEKRAAELIIANKELAFQNEEKEKRAAELSIINGELKEAEAGIRKLNEELEQKVIERTVQLETANKDLESFSYSVSHDLRAPIRAINGYAKILEEDYLGKLDAGGIKVLYSIVSNSKKMGNLIDDLLEFSKLGRKQVAVSSINMEALVKSIKEESLLDDIDKKIDFTISELPAAKGNPALIKQVWINLISNAIKYSKNKLRPLIEIGASRKDKLVIYHVKDNGAGFDMKYYNKLFGVFQRLHSQEKFNGTGIGLAIVQKIVQRHNGTVWAESKPDEGACFYFSLPAI